MIRKAKAVWRGTGRAGSGNLSTDSGVLAETSYSFKTRFENEKGTNPEELIAAAHAGCFTMALAFGLQLPQPAAQPRDLGVPVGEDAADHGERLLGSPGLVSKQRRRRPVARHVGPGLEVDLGGLGAGGAGQLTAPAHGHHNDADEDHDGHEDDCDGHT